MLVYDQAKAYSNSMKKSEHDGFGGCASDSDKDLILNRVNLQMAG